MKAGLNKMDIKRYHNMLKGDEENKPMSLPKIAKLLHTKVEVLKRLSPKLYEKAEKEAKKALQAVEQRRIANKEKAEAMTAAAAKLMDGDSSAASQALKDALADAEAAKKASVDALKETEELKKALAKELEDLQKLTKGVKPAASETKEAGAKDTKLGI